MIDRKLLYRLVIPLLSVAIIGIIFIWPPRWDDLVYNLIVEIISILITILFVDWLIKSRENEKWQQVDMLIRADFASWSLKFIAETTLFIQAGGVSLPKPSKTNSPNKKWGFALEYATFDNIHAAIFDTNLIDRESFLASLKDKINDLLALYSRYSNRLSAQEIELILEIEGTLRSLVTEMSFIDNDTDLSNLANGNTAGIDSLWIKHVEKTAEVLKEAITQSLELFGKFLPQSK
jgi:hypothetical protein